MTDSAAGTPIHVEMWDAIRDLRDQLGEVESTLHAAGDPHDTARAVTALAPTLNALGAALDRWATALSRRRTPEPCHCADDDDGYRYDPAAEAYVHARCDGLRADGPTVESVMAFASRVLERRREREARQGRCGT